MSYREEWMSDTQFECYEFLADLLGGFHHVRGTIKPAANGIQNSTYSPNHLATFDFNLLTKAVVMAHDRCIRFEIAPSGPNMLRFYVHKRNGREGQMAVRHPTLEEHVANIRKGLA